MSAIRTRHVSATALAATACLLGAMPRAGAASPTGLTLSEPPSTTATTPPYLTRQGLKPKLPTTIVDADAAARQPFQAILTFSAATGSSEVAIPAGYRLVVEYINAVTLDVSTTFFQPLIFLYSIQGTNPLVGYEFFPGATPVASEDTLNQQLTIYADKLTVSLGYSGSPPSSAYEQVTISGHLIAITPP
jgi:hypothetical protein